jgi:uncharacterized circularly permuted ATP-grasp superfamily protein
MTAPAGAPPWAPYLPDHRDEALDADGAWRPHMTAALRDVTRTELRAVTAAIERDTRGAGLVFPTADGAETFVVDPVPRVIDAAEWAVIERGVAQRVRALNAFVADVYGERRAVAEGVIPARVMDEAEHHEPAAAGLRPPSGVWIGVAATRTAIRDTPHAFVAQELTPLSTHPTVVDGRLQPRHVDLRPFTFVTPDGDGGTHAALLPGGLTRVALKEGSMIVNSSQDGGAKDTWVLP